MTELPEIDECTIQEYFNCQVKVYKITGAHPYPWRFIVSHNKVVHRYAGIPNYCASKASALKRGWYRAKWFNDGTYAERY